MFRRAQALLVVLALLATPLALFARTANPDACDGMCCLPHGSHPSSMHHAQATAPAKDADCHHAALSCAIECSMKSSHHQFHFGLLAPIAPTKPSAFVSLAVNQTSKAIPFPSNQTHITAFATTPFQPPRS